MSQSGLRCIIFTLAGPITPQNAAFEFLGLVPGGHKLFAALSRYDDLLALSGRPGYEPGDTLALMVPFLLRHALSEEELVTLAAEAPLTEGAAALVGDLSARGYEAFCITTTYEQYARPVASRAGIDPEKVAATSFPLQYLRETLAPADFAPVERTEAALAEFDLERQEERLRRVLDGLFWSELPGTALGEAIQVVVPVGGKRKVRTLGQFASLYQLDLSRWVAVGDGIADAALLEVIRNAGGLAVAFNGNRYALAAATVGLASTTLADLAPLLTAWEEGGLGGAQRFVAATNGEAAADGPRYHWLHDATQYDEALAVHERFRALVRQEAGRLG
ncbi:MAG: hypothetical protein HYS09_03695 [Chloroflexi bacterium]|nr:hypothetical protein [Chloroflexota bacterium]